MPDTPARAKMGHPHPVRDAGAVAEEWEELIANQGGHIERVIRSLSSGSAAARSRLAASWQRSWQKHGLDPAQTPRRAPDTVRLRERRDQLGPVLAVAAPRLNELFVMLGQCGCGVLLTDAEGVVIDSRCAAGDADVFRNWGLTPGTDWSEAAQGTNGIGTCLAERRAVTIHRDQHYLAGNIGMSCIDAPIFGPDAALVAALDVSSARADHTEGFNRLIEAMVAQVAHQIESELFRSAFSRHRILLAGTGGDAQSAALLAVDDDDVVVGATREARRLHGLELAGTIRPRPIADVLGRSGTGEGLVRAERAAVIRALTRADGNVSQAAQALGMSRATLYRRMKRLGIDDFRPGLSRI
ncbi:GAF domain-containing protein [Plastorhodobacter daqingensis]|uniref:GAF domain-containing protein n=1 Tax=Plastorhodobacter daqingensis TaxID=1387281 RepID=A0ABW2UL54_9RHOB